MRSYPYNYKTTIARFMDQKNGEECTPEFFFHGKL